MTRFARSSARRESRAARSSRRSRTRCSRRTRRRRARPGTRPWSSTTAATSACSRSRSRRTSRCACSTRRASARSTSSSASRRRRARRTTRCSPTTISRSTGPRSPTDLIKREDVTPDNFGRIAAQTAKQVILQRIREAEREMMYDEYIDRVGEVVTGIVQQTGDRRNILVDLGKVEALLPGPEQVDGERYEQGSRIKAVIREVRTGTKGPQVILSRRDPELIKTLFELEVPGDRRRPRRDPRRRPRAGLPLEDRGRVARPGRRPGRRVRRPARLARPHGRLGAPRREDRHHPVEQRAGAVRREGALAGARPRGLPRRRGHARRPSSSPTTSSRSRSARKA